MTGGGSALLALEIFLKKEHRRIIILLYKAILDLTSSRENASLQDIGYKNMLFTG